MCVFDELRKVYIVKIQSNLPVFPKISVLDTKSIKVCSFSESKRLTPVNSTFLERQIEVELPSAAQNYVDTGSYLSSRRARMPIPGNTTSLPLRLWHQQLQILLTLLLLCASGCAIHQPTLPVVFQCARTLEGRALPAQRDYWTAFRNPSKFNATGLYLLEPYQPGRIPLVLIHGLASDAFTWEEIIAALRSNPEIASRYQIWVYQYPTGVSYLRSAANLRKELVNIRQVLDPDSHDPAFDQTVLAGHSMGGLLARLQVSYSDENLWRAVSDQPLSTVFDEGPLPEEMVSALVFEPVPYVKRVIFLATPHRGSNWSQQPLGRIGRWLINVPQQVQEEYSGLVRGNPGLFRNPALGPPTSIDHLSPCDSIMRATSRLRYANSVAKHSIIGTGYLSPDGCVGDGVVAVPSARIPSVQTELFVLASHSGVLRSPAVAEELMCILTRL